MRYQRKVRQRENLTSVLDGIPGVGPARRKALTREFGRHAARRLQGLRDPGVSGVLG